MKKLAILSMSVFLVLAFIQLPAEVVMKDTIKTEIKKTKKEIRQKKEDLKKLKGSYVSEFSKNQFYADFGNVKNVHWKKTKYFDEVEFTIAGKQMKAYYDLTNTLVGTTMTKSFTDLSSRAQKKIMAKYYDCEIVKVLFFNENEKNSTPMYLWDTKFENTDSYFVELVKDNKNIVLKVNGGSKPLLFAEY